MKFKMTGKGRSGHMVGVAFLPSGAERDLCESYAALSSRLIDASFDSLVPVLVSDPWPFHDPTGARRRIYSSEDAPGVASAIEMAAGMGGDVLVLLPECQASSPMPHAELAWMVILDAATWAADNNPSADNLGWAAEEVTRAAIAARILRAAECAGLLNARDAADIYRAICGTAMAALAERSSIENGAALLTREAPGLASFIDRVVRRARNSAPSQLPLDLGAEGELAVEDIAAAFESANQKAHPKAA